jgi:predicted nuclease of predicted toxin-antitoxin system
MKLLVDMNLSPRWVQFLSDSGWQALHWSSIGFPNAPDTEIALFAAANDFVIVTNDLDFAAILALSKLSKPSVVQIRSLDLSPFRIGSSVIAAIRQTEQELERGAIVTIEPDRTRLRLLPLEFDA